METIRLEEYTGLIQNKIVAVWQTPEAVNPWLPTEFMLSTYITRILVAGRASPMSMAFVSDPSWTQIWRSPGAKEWSCLLGILPHMPGPILLVISPDMVLTPKLVAAFKMPTLTTLVLRQGVGWTEPLAIADQVFFPVVDGAKHAGLVGVLQEWTSRTVPKSLDLRTVVPQLTAQGYGLAIAEGIWHWYKPADSPPMVSLTIPQIARQLQILGTVLEKHV
jgi:hypothetical protein